MLQPEAALPGPTDGEVVAGSGELGVTHPQGADRVHTLCPGGILSASGKGTPQAASQVMSLRSEAKPSIQS